MWQSSGAIEAQIRNTRAFYHWATALSTLYEMGAFTNRNGPERTGMDRNGPP